MWQIKKLLTSQGRCTEEQQKAELWVPHDGFVEALSLGCNEYSDETGSSALDQDLYTLSWALIEDREEQTVLWRLKVHPIFLCGGTKAKGLKNVHDSVLQNWSILIIFRIYSYSCIKDAFLKYILIHTQLIEVLIDERPTKVNLIRYCWFHNTEQLLL